MMAQTVFFYISGFVLSLLLLSISVDRLFIQRGLSQNSSSLSHHGADVLLEQLRHESGSADR